MLSSVERFLETVDEVGNAFSGLRMGDKVVPLYHCFWSADEIANGRIIKGDWDVPEDLIPFYGDWHTLLCISVTSGEILLLDDQRATEFVWPSSEDFLNCLTNDPALEERSPSDPKMTSLWISDDLDAAIRKMIEEDARKK